MIQDKRTRRWLVITAVVAATSGLWGCSSSGFDNQGLVPPGFSRGTRGAMDGFVFVPSRAANTAIPNAQVVVYEVGADGKPGAQLFTTQANAEGFYRVSGQPLNKLLVAEAVDPFAIPGRVSRKVQGLVAFSVAEERTRNLNPPSTLAAAISRVKAVSAPLSEEQIGALEAKAEARLALPGAPDITADPVALDRLAREMSSETFGTADIFVFSRPAVTASVIINGVTVGQVQTLLPGAAPASNMVHLTELAVGRVPVQIKAPGFLPDVFVLDVQAGENVVSQRTLTLKPVEADNAAPSIVDVRAVPVRLPSAGGEVLLQAIVSDPEADSVEVEASVTYPPQTGALAGRVDTIKLSSVGKYLYVGKFVAPANQHAGNATYSVVVTASDATHRDKPAKRHFNFQVAGLR